MNKFTKQCVAAVASLAMAGTLCVAGAVVAGSSAWAVDGTECTANKAPWDTTQTANCVGSITIKKYEDKGNGDTSVPLPGAKFKVQRVTKLSTSDTTNTDLKDYKNWEALATKVKSLNDNPNQAGMEFDASATQEAVTGSDGSKKFSNLPIGLYKVEETQPAPGHSNDVTPFYMTIPEITHEANKQVTYDYNVTAKPKNQSLAGKITKTLVRGENETAFVGNGDTMTYKISAAVTSNTATERKNWTKDDLTGYTVFDQAPAGVFNDYTAAVVKSATVVYKENGTTDKSVPLKDDKGTNNISVATEDVKGKDNNTTVATRIKVSFNETGLTSIATAAKADANAKVEVEFAFTIKDPTQVTEKSFTNKSGFIPGQGKNKPTPTPEVPGDGGSTVTSNYGYLQVNKYDGTFKSTDANTQTSKPKLAGAKFKLFAKKTDADACAANTSATECQNASKVGELTTVDGGKFQTPVKVVVDDSTHPFYIVETEAPANYERDHQAHKAVVLATSTEQNPTSVDIANVPTKDNGSWFHLPKTGAAGVVIFALAGVCLVCFGIFVFMRNRKKEEEQQAA